MPSLNASGSVWKRACAKGLKPSRRPSRAHMLRGLIDGSDDELRNFVVTVSVVSNHGNWFTAENHNKELKVLAHSYDWLLFLTDRGLSEFVSELLLKPKPDLEPA